MAEPVPVMEPSRLKTLSLKILTSYWSSDYSQAQKVAYLPSDKIPSSYQINMPACLARKQVAESVRVLLENRQECGEDIFLPLLKIRCQKEISSCQQRLQKSSSDRDYFSASCEAWERVLSIVE